MKQKIEIEIYNLILEKSLKDSSVIKVNEQLTKVSDIDEDGFFNVEFNDGDNIKKYFWVNISEVKKIENKIVEMTEQQIKEKNQNIKEIFSKK